MPAGCSRRARSSRSLQRLHSGSSLGGDSAALRGPDLRPAFALLDRRRSLSDVTIFSTSTFAVGKSPRRYPVIMFRPCAMRYRSQSRPSQPVGARTEVIETSRKASASASAACGAGASPSFKMSSPSGATTARPNVARSTSPREAL